MIRFQELAAAWSKDQRARKEQHISASKRVSLANRNLDKYLKGPNQRTEEGVEQCPSSKEQFVTRLQEAWCSRSPSDTKAALVPPVRSSHSRDGSRTDRTVKSGPMKARSHQHSQMMQQEANRAQDFPLAGAPRERGQSVTNAAFVA
jgi:hypothetical protein